MRRAVELVALAVLIAGAFLALVFTVGYLAFGP